VRFIEKREHCKQVSKLEMETPMQLTRETIQADTGIVIVRDDLLAGGTKVRGLLPYIGDITSRDPGVVEFVYPSPAFGYAQVALSECCKRLGLKCTMFVAKRKIKHENTLLAEENGAQVVEIFPGYLSVVKKRAKEYVDVDPKTRVIVPWGGCEPEYRAHLTSAIVRALTSAITTLEMLEPKRMWVCVGSGTLFESLHEALPNTRFNLVLVGAKYQVQSRHRERVIAVYKAPEKYEKKAKNKPPYPSNLWYDAKMWQFITAHAREGDFVWNVAA
jgi:hypothetical protein